MKRNIILIIASVAIAAVIALVSGLRIFSGEDDWMCRSGRWVRHGNPSAPMPSEPCSAAPVISVNRPTVSPSAGTSPVTPALKLLTVKLYFNNNKMDPEISCNKVFPVTRDVMDTPEIGRAALEQLLLGPAESEKAAGFFTNIPTGVKIQKLTIVDGVARVDFDERLEFQGGGSCHVAAIRAKITETLKQFPTVKDVIISINGRTEDILQP